MKGDKNVISNSPTSDGNTQRRLRTDIRERISNRGGNSSKGSNGLSSNDNGTTDPPTIPRTTDTNLDRTINTEGTIDRTEDGFFFTERNDNGRNTGGSSSGRGRGDSNTGIGNNDIGTETQYSTPVVSVKPSLLRVTEISNDDDGLIIKGGKKKPGRPAGITKRKSINSDLVIPLKIACGFIFSLPTYFGWGKHWELSDDENTELSTNVKDVLDAFPSDTAIDFLKHLDKWMPVIILGMSLYTMTNLRYQMTRQLLAQKLKPQNKTNPEPQLQVEHDAKNESGEKIITKRLVM